MNFARFMATPWGRGLRIVVGIMLITSGAVATYADIATAGLLMTIAGTGLAVMGMANVCPLALLFGGPVDGRAVSPRSA